jgi:hypothetical protein
MCIRDRFNAARKEYVKAYWASVKNGRDKREAQKVADLISHYILNYPFLLRTNEVEEIKAIADEAKAIIEE